MGHATMRARASAVCARGALPALLALLAVESCDAYSSYKSKIPNGGTMQGAGHSVCTSSSNCGGGGARNSFGTAFKNSGRVWTTALCNADSDGDGQSNGLELGDPCCVWTSGATPFRTTDLSAPGSSSDTTSAAMPDCSASDSDDDDSDNGGSSTDTTTTTTTDSSASSSNSFSGSSSDSGSGSSDSGTGSSNSGGGSSSSESTTATKNASNAQADKNDAELQSSAAGPASLRFVATAHILALFGLWF